MDFENILTLASQNQGLSSSQVKRYSLQTGPAKKVPKVKGVESAAVQAFLKRREMEQKQKEMQSKKQKEELLAKRVELKSDRKARAMASRTKDNFRGYNGIPVVDQPRKRRSKGHANHQSQEDLEDEDHYEYSQTDSDPEPEPEPEPQKLRCEVSIKDLGKPAKKPTAKSAPPPMNFEALLKLAEKKQYEPVELKPKKKSEERLRTAEELRELEIERKVKRQDKGRDTRPEADVNSSASRKRLIDKDVRNGTSLKGSSEKLPHSGLVKKPKPPTSVERSYNTAKPTQGNKHASNSSKATGALSSKSAVKASSQVPHRPPGPRPYAVQRPDSTSDLSQKRGTPPIPPGKLSSLGTRPGTASSLASARASSAGLVRPGSSGPVRPNSGSSNERPRPSLAAGMNKAVKPSQGSSGKMGFAASTLPGKGDPIRSASSLPARAGTNGQMRPPVGGSARQDALQSGAVGSSQPRLGNGGIRPAPSGPGRPGRGMVQPLNGMAAGPGRPKCTVVSETISSKNVAPRSGIPQTLPPGYRPVMRPPGTMLPPITSSYKRKYEDEEEYDPEMDDFIDDGGDDQDEISKHIREIFGYDRTRYRDESDYALKFMESSWKDQQKEEARSLRLGIEEDKEDMRLEEEEKKKKVERNTKRKRM